MFKVFVIFMYIEEKMSDSGERKRNVIYMEKSDYYWFVEDEF